MKADIVSRRASTGPRGNAGTIANFEDSTANVRTIQAIRP